MSFAEAGEVAHIRGAAEGVVEGVVPIAPVGGLSASGESAVLIPSPEEPFHIRRRGISVHRESTSRDRVGEDPIPPGRVPCELAGRSRVDRAPPDQVGGLVGHAGQRQRGHCDVHDSADRPETPEPKLMRVPGMKNIKNKSNSV